MNAPPETLRIFAMARKDWQALVAMGASVEPFRELASYSSFGVQFRYEAFDDPGEEPLDRAKVVQDVTELLRVVEALLQS